MNFVSASGNYKSLLRERVFFLQGEREQDSWRSYRFIPRGCFMTVGLCMCMCSSIHYIKQCIRDCVRLCVCARMHVYVCVSMFEKPSNTCLCFCVCALFYTHSPLTHTLYLTHIHPQTHFLSHTCTLSQTDTPSHTPTHTHIVLALPGIWCT